MIAPALLTLSEFTDRHYLPESSLSPRTVQQVRYVVARWGRLTGDPPLSEAEDAAWAFRAGLNGLAPATVNSYLGHVAAILSHAKRRRLIADVPELPRLRATRRLRHVPTVEDLSAAYRHAGAARWPTFCEPRTFWRAWLALGYLTGLRLSDMMHRLLWANVRADRIEVEVRKTGRVQVWPVTAWAARHLSVMSAVPHDGRVLPVSRSPHLVRRSLREICEVAGVAAMTPHALRRLSITEWSVASADAGALVHGTGLKVRSYYVDPLRVLAEASGRLAVPAAFLEPDGPGVEQLRLFE